MLGMDGQAVAHAVRLIRSRAIGELEVADVHNSVPLSRRSLEVRFKKAMGRTSEQEIRRVRIDRAKRLLTSTDLPMDDITARSGVPTAQRLSAVFAHGEGEPPPRTVAASAMITDGNTSSADVNRLQCPLSHCPILRNPIRNPRRIARVANAPGTNRKPKYQRGLR